ncbi:UDP-N-acetylmuramate dehydrogenase [Candidatus Peregrinibacteria bacterium]|nr:UDP-N-acetylmuramate dehydrogenase [Candidatus Peregrinibacteria bacterium]
MGIYSSKKDQFSEDLRRRISVREPLNKYCLYRVGGPADLFFTAKSADDLENIVMEAQSLRIPFLVIGKGSNVLFGDSGYTGLVIQNTAGNITVAYDKTNTDHPLLEVESGVSVADLLRALQDQRSFQLVLSRSGVPQYFDSSLLAEFQGIPGTIGGAVYGNAGCFGKEIGDFVEKVEILDIANATAQKKSLSKNDGTLRFMYRWSSMKEKDERENNHRTNTVIVKAFLRLSLTDIPPKIAVDDALRKARSEKQPPGFSCGSFFKNPSSGKSAGELIEAAGFKGKRMGGAQISEKHGNFILNVGGAKTSDILGLAEEVKKEVFRHFGVELEEEVRVY